jgi:hypothetical protein
MLQDHAKSMQIEPGTWRGACVEQPRHSPSVVLRQILIERKLNL